MVRPRKGKVPPKSPIPRAEKRKAPEDTRNKNKPKNQRYDIPAGSTINQHGTLVPPRNKSPSQMSTASSTSSLAASIPDRAKNGAQQQKSAPDLTGTAQINVHATDSKRRKTKPINIDANYKVVNQMLVDLKLPIKPLMSIVTSRGSNTQTRVECSTLDDKIAVIAKLKSLAIPFFTHPERGERTKVFVFKNVPRHELNEMTKFAVEAGIPVKKISFLVDDPDRPIYLLHSDDKSLDIDKLQKLRKPFGLVIPFWQPFDLRRKRPNPCKRCKLWGHTASSCGRQFRCGRCLETHEPGATKCARQDLSIGTPKCVNCRGDHAANNTQCPAYSEYVTNLERRRQRQLTTNKRRQVPVTVSSASTACQPSAGTADSQIFQIPQNNASSYSAIVRNSLNASGSSQNSPSFPLSSDSNPLDSLAKFAAIPGIGRTMELFAEMTAKLSSTTHDYERLLILAQYCSPPTNNGT